jgi:hypothetical protein
LKRRGTISVPGVMAGAMAGLVAIALAVVF